MSRNIRANFKHLNTTYMKTLSKQNTDIQLDFDVSSFQTSNNFSKKSSANDTNTNTHTNSNNTSKHFTNSKIKQNNINDKKTLFSNFSVFNMTNHHNRSRSNYLKKNNNNYLLQNNSLNKESQTFSKIKKKIKTKPKELNPHSLNFKPLISTITKTDYNSLNTSKSSKMKISKEKNKKIKAFSKLKLKKSKTGKNLNINIKNNYSNLSSKLGSPGINRFIIKTNFNSPLDSDRKEKEIITLNNELLNKNKEINNLKMRINEQDKYINNLENKIKSIRNNKKDDEEEYEQYSKKMILRNIKALTSENEELNKQIKEYKEKEIKIMRALYYISKQGISIDKFLDGNNEE